MGTDVMETKEQDNWSLVKAEVGKEEDMRTPDIEEEENGCR